MAIEIVSFSSYNMVIFNSYVTDYQRVTTMGIMNDQTNNS